MNLLLLLGAGAGTTATAGVVLTIDGVEQRMLQGWYISATQNGRATFRFRVLSELGVGSGSGRHYMGMSLLLWSGSGSGGSSTYRPSLDDEVVLVEDGVTVFGGVITDTMEAGAVNKPNAPIITTISASDFNGLAKRRHVTAELVAPTLKVAVTEIVGYLPGVTLDPGQSDGPTLPNIDWKDVLAEDALNEISAWTNSTWTWNISHLKVLLMFELGTIAAPCSINVPDRVAIGDVTVEPTRQDYANRIIARTATYRKTADDAGEQASHGIYELVVTAPDDTPEDGVQAIADGFLARSTPILKKVRYTTYEKGLEPGQTQIIDIDGRNVNNTYVIDEIRSRDDGGNRILRDVTATEGLVYRPGYRETYKRWNGTGLTVAGAVFGGGGAGGFDRFAYFLGGASTAAVKSATPTWVPVSGGTALGTGANQVQINTVPRGTTSASIVARLRAFSAGVSVQARLYDVTDSVACSGVSAVVTSTAWETVTFGVTLTTGSHLYELQLLPGSPNEPVYGVGYLE